jgi:lipopolysaccharide transport system permease protein
MLVIRPGEARILPRLRETWEAREVVYFLVWRNLKVRYKQTVLGVSWAVLQPVLMMIVFSVFFGALAKVPSDNVPYPIFAYCGLLPWQLFSYALTNSAASLVENERLVTKVYFPRLAIPLASVFAGVVDFAIAFVVLLLMMLYYGMAPGRWVFAIPVVMVLAVATAVAVGVGLAALNVRYRDVRYALPFLSQLWMFATPIAYPASIVPGQWRPLYGLNPMVGVVEGFRWALLGGVGVPGLLIAVATCVTALALSLGLLYFVRVERSFADIV